MLPQVKNQDYEFRVVMIGSSMIFAIWLHEKSDDILIPISDGYGKWKACQPYSVKQFAKLLKPVAEDEIKQGEMNRAISSAMEDYEKVNGNKCGDITYLGGMSDIKIIGPNVWTCELEGISGKCGSLDYQARITYADKSYTIMKRVEILKKSPSANNVTKP